MSFFDEEPMSLPRDGQYYFNILVVCIGVSPQLMQENGFSDLLDIWDIQELTEPRPKIIHIYQDECLDEDIEYEMTYFPHCVVEVSPSLGVSWWDMLDFETDDPWRIDSDEENYS